MKNIVLCGFMGAGKTTVGKRLSVLAGVPFYDIDDLVEREAGLSVSDIFKSQGEVRFRALEQDAVRQTAVKDGVVIAVGGGTLCDPENVRLLKKNGVIVLLAVTFHEVLERLSGDLSRPLLAAGSEAVERLYHERIPVYESAADIIINAEGTDRETANTIFRRVF